MHEDGSNGEDIAKSTEQPEASHRSADESVRLAQSKNRISRFLPRLRRRVSESENTEVISMEPEQVVHQPEPATELSSFDDTESPEFTEIVNSSLPKEQPESRNPDYNKTYELIHATDRLVSQRIDFLIKNYGSDKYKEIALFESRHRSALIAAERFMESGQYDEAQRLIEMIGLIDVEAPLDNGAESATPDTNVSVHENDSTIDSQDSGIHDTAQPNLIAEAAIGGEVEDINLDNEDRPEALKLESSNDYSITEMADLVSKTLGTQNRPDESNLSYVKTPDGRMLAREAVRPVEGTFPSNPEEKAAFLVNHYDGISVGPLPEFLDALSKVGEYSLPRAPKRMAVTADGQSVASTEYDGITKGASIEAQLSLVAKRLSSEDGGGNYIKSDARRIGEDEYYKRTMRTALPKIAEVMLAQRSSVHREVGNKISEIYDKQHEYSFGQQMPEELKAEIKAEVDRYDAILSAALEPILALSDTFANHQDGDEASNGDFGLHSLASESSAGGKLDNMTQKLFRDPEILRMIERSKAEHQKEYLRALYKEFSDIFKAIIARRDAINAEIKEKYDKTRPYEAKRDYMPEVEAGIKAQIAAEKASYEAEMLAELKSLLKMCVSMMRFHPPTQW